MFNDPVKTANFIGALTPTLCASVLGPPLLSAYYVSGVLFYPSKFLTPYIINNIIGYSSTIESYYSKINRNIKTFYKT